MFRRFVRPAVCLLALGLALPVAADVAVPSMFSDHAVLQRGIPVPVWGTASPGESVTVTFLGQSKSTAADGSGAWMIPYCPISRPTGGWGEQVAHEPVYAAARR